MKSGGGSRQLRGPGSAPGFARATGAPKEGQLARSSGRAPNAGQTKMPGNQGGRSEASKKS